MKIFIKKLSKLFFFLLVSILLLKLSSRAALALTCDHIGGRILDSNNEVLQEKTIIVYLDGVEILNTGTTYTADPGGGFLFPLDQEYTGNFEITIIPGTGSSGTTFEEQTFSLASCTVGTFILDQELPPAVTFPSDPPAPVLGEPEAILPKGCYIWYDPLQHSAGSDIGIQTAIGCIPTTFESFIRVFLAWAVGLAGGAAFILMLFAAFQLLTSGGNPEKVKAASERLTSAIIGLLFIIFSVFLLRIIGQPIMMLGS